MSRLPNIGQDDGTWGNILNDFLSQSLNSDGSLKASSVAASAPVSSVAGKTGVISLVESDVANLATDLAATEKTANKGAASGYAPLDGTSKVPIANLPLGTTANTVVVGNDSRLTGAVTANQLGYLNALANGVSTSGDQTANISAFFDACNTAGKAAYFPVGTYQCGLITKNYSLNIFSDPGTIIQTNAGGTCWTFQGALSGTTTPITANASQNTITLVVGAGNIPSGLTVGSLLLVGTTTTINGDNPSNRYCGQLVEVASITSGTGTITICEGLYRTFTTAESAYVELVNSIGPMSIKGLKFTNPNNNNLGFVTIAYARDVDCEIDGDGAQQPGVAYKSVYNFRFKGRAEHYKWDNTTQFGYTFAAEAASTHGESDTITVNGSYGFQTTAVNGWAGEPGDIVVRGVNSGSTTSAWGTHPAGWDITFDNVQAYACGDAGIGASCPRVTYNNPVVDGTGLNPLWTGNGAWITNGGAGGLSGLRIRGGTFRNIAGSGINLNVTAGMTDFEITGNDFDVVKADCIVSTGPLTNYQQHGNRYRSYGSAGSGVNYGWRHTQTLTGADIYEEDIDASGANNAVCYVDLAASDTNVFRVKARNVGGSGSFWAHDVGGVVYYDNVINGVKTEKVVSVTSSATPTFDPTLGANQTMTLTANVTSSAMPAALDATVLRLTLLQDSTGGWTFAWPSTVLFPGGATPTLRSEANARVVLTFLYSQALGKWLHIGSAPALAPFAIRTGGDSTKGITIQANSSTQSSDLFDVLDSSGNVMTKVDATGFLAVYRSGSAVPTIISAQPGDAHARGQVNNDGSIQFGDGTANLDTTVQRSAAGVLSVPALSLGTLPGGTGLVASRYVGAVNGAAPSGGTFATGDWVIDISNGAVRVCTSGGSPGIWVATSPAFPASASISGTQQRVLSAGQPGDAHPRMQINNDSIQFGDGTNNVDTLLSRPSAGRLQVPALQASGLSGSTGISTGAFVGVVSGAAPTGTGVTYAVGDWVVDKSSGSTWICATSGAPGTWINSRQNTTPQSLWMRTGAKAETFPRAGARISEAVASLSSGRLTVYGITLEAGVTISSVTFLSSAAASGQTNQWFCLLDSSLNVLRTTNDDTTNGWAATSEKTLSLASSYTPVNRMAAYIGINVTGTTPPTLQGYSEGASVMFYSPAVAAISSSGLTTPASLGSTAAALSAASGGYAWAYVS